MNATSDHVPDSTPPTPQGNSEPRHATPIDSGRVGHPYRILAIATDIDELLWFAGGWIFDHASAGWTVDVVATSRLSDHRPLTIIGANSLPHTAIPSLPDPEPPIEVLIGASSVHRDGLTRAYARQASDRGKPNITVWGAICDTGSAPLKVFTHHLSPAARAFKLHALLAAGRSVDNVATTEQMWAPRTRPQLKSLLTSWNPLAEER